MIGADTVAQATRTRTLGVCVASVVAVLLLLPLSLFLRVAPCGPVARRGRASGRQAGQDGTGGGAELLVVADDVDL